MIDRREKIAEILNPEEYGNKSYYQTDQILSLITPDGIEWVGECPDMAMDCPRCNGTGKITRDATLEEVMEAFTSILRQETPISDITMGICLSRNGGQIRLKEV